MTHSEFFDALETRDPQQREQDLLSRLPGLIGQAQQAAGWAHILAGVTAGDITTRAALSQLPVTRKSALSALQAQSAPFAGLNTTAPRELARIFMSPGPIFDPQGRGADWANFARPLHALGARAGHLIQNCYSYHFTPAAFMVEAGAARLGCTVLPAGTGQTEMQVLAMQRLRPEIYAGTPSFLKIILEHAHSKGQDVSSLQYALVSGEALPPSLRHTLQQLGVGTVRQMYGMADVGCVAYETACNGVLNPGMVLEEQILLEIVRPGSGEPVGEGEVGEVLVTSFSPDYPLIRFATGDLSAVLPGISPCGRSNTRIRGWLGRADQTTKVRAMFVHPVHVTEIVQRHHQISKARLVLSGAVGNEVMALLCEVHAAQTMPESGELAGLIAASIRDVTKLRGEVEFVAVGSLPNDSLLIEDRRDYR